MGVAPILTDVTEAPWQPGQPEHRHPAADQPPAPGSAPAVPTPVWLHGAMQPAPPAGADAWQPGPAPEPADPAPGAVPAEPPESWSQILPPPEVRSHRAAVVVLSVLLAIALAAGAGLTWYLLRVNAAWQEHSQQWEALAEQHGNDLAQARADLEATRTELQAVQDQLATAQTRITQLADEKAQLGDESAAQQQLADYQARVSKAAGQVATALATCIDGQEQLIGYIENSAAFDQAQLAAYRQDVENYCGNARDANAALQAELNQ